MKQMLATIIILILTASCKLVSITIEATAETDTPAPTASPFVTITPSRTATLSPSSTLTPTIALVSTPLPSPTATPTLTQIPTQSTMTISMMPAGDVSMYAPSLGNINKCIVANENQEYALDQWNNEYSLCTSNGVPDELFCAGATYGWLSAASYICKYDANQKIKFGINTQAYTNNGCSLSGAHSGGGGYILGMRYAPSINDAFFANPFMNISLLSSMTLSTGFTPEYYSQAQCPDGVPLGNGNGVPNSQAHFSAVFTKIVNGAGEKVFYYQVALWDNRPEYLNPTFSYRYCGNFNSIVTDPITRYGYASPQLGIKGHYTINILNRVRELISDCVGDNSNSGAWYLTGLYLTSESLNTAISTYSYEYPSVILGR